MSAPNIFDSSAPAHLGGVRGTETAHRKIELQAPEDLTFLVAKLSEAARERIEKEFSTAAAAAAATEQGKDGGIGVDINGEDQAALRRRVEELVDEYVRETFSAAKDSLSINGMDSQELDAELAKIQEGEELAPFDTSLATKIQSLSTQIEAQTLHLASVRRKAPAQSAQRFLSNFEAQLASSAARLRSDEEARLAEARGASVSAGILPPRPEEVGETFLRGVRDLQGVKGGIAATLDRLERAQRAVEVVGEK
ncbi:uncharacterized protein K489DRAFT_382552 [Dissoconium aciculare CBS 342.82]|uniref:Mis14-domain-containing protein n=1 Tax=Dissoconium aciculare CBS 342.82 TaxID=1314786 RepID=A0A6J3M132_9PEZI|nr:uncharacterized protein K489DRAFT_382552 [Dissoconium aciculare CBS 342.82]KAF1820627.1 hypothetical protein K489DRAFT_382552 [Dissoconium aciculare CBS 342.82]